MKKCPDCGKVFLQPSLIERHRRFMHGLKEEKPVEVVDGSTRKNGLYRCDICGKGYTSQPYLLSHVEMHSELWSYRCKHCKKAFITPSKLKRHLASCIGDEPSDSMIKQAEKLQEIVNTGEEIEETSESSAASSSIVNDTLVDEKCESTSGSSETLEQGALKDEIHAEGLLNVKVIIGASNPHWEGWKEADAENMDKLIKTIHENRYLCKLCNLTFGRRNVAQRHLKSHKFYYVNECPFCNEKYKWPTDLRRHISETHELKQFHQCKYCKKFLKNVRILENHLATHHGEISRGYSCTLCSQAFIRGAQLSAHVREAHSEEMTSINEVEPVK